jgi:hypothetical protein
MRTRLAFGILLLAALGLAVTTTAGKPAKPPQGTPVTVAIPDEGYAILNDGSDLYANGVDGVTAVIVPLGNLQLKTGTAGRTFWLDFGSCYQNCDPDPPTGYRQGYMTTSCPVPLPNMTEGAFQFCNLNVHFTANGLGWFIRFGEYEDTNPATVTRISGTSWTIDVAQDDIALLQSYPTKGRVTFTDHGYFYMPVNLTVTQ